MVAKDENTLLYLSEQLKQRKIKRIYEALVSGIILHDTGTIDARLVGIKIIDKNDCD